MDKTTASIFGALSAFVFVEPAPVDIMALIIGVYALISGKISFQRVHYRVIIPVALIGLFLLINGFGVLDATATLPSLQYFVITTYLAGYLILSSFSTKGISVSLIRGMFNGMCLAAVFSVLFGVCQIFNVLPGITMGIKNFMEIFSNSIPSHEVGVVYGTRISGFFKDPNVFGPFLIPVILYSMMRISEEKGLGIIKWVGLNIIFISGVILTFSRGAWVNGVVSIIILLLLFLSIKETGIMRKSNIIFYIAVIVTIVLFGSTYASFLGDAVWNTFNARSSYQSYDDDRFATQYRSFVLAQDNLFGVGPGQSEAKLGMSNHSLYARTALDNGYSGLVVLLLFIFLTGCRLLYILKACDNQSRGIIFVIIASFIGILVNSVVIDTIHWRNFWILLALVWNVQMRTEQEQQQDQTTKKIK